MNADTAAPAAAMEEGEDWVEGVKAVTNRS
jgi:hypothetical protein